MSRFEQYEIWALHGEKWELVASFANFDVANAMTRNRSSRVRLIHAIYEEGKPVEQEVLAEVGATRQTP
ncbi:MAG: hypothetical protein ACE14M_13835 [Terriglobales bacterium]